MPKQPTTKRPSGTLTLRSRTTTVCTVDAPAISTPKHDYGEDDTEQEDADPWETEESDEPEDADGGGDEESENPAN